MQILDWQQKLGQEGSGWLINIYLIDSGLVMLVTSGLSQLCMTVGSGLCSGPGTTDTAASQSLTASVQPPNTAVPGPASAVGSELNYFAKQFDISSSDYNDILFFFVFHDVSITQSVSMKTAMDTDRCPLRRGGGRLVT